MVQHSLLVNILSIVLFVGVLVAARWVCYQPEVLLQLILFPFGPFLIQKWPRVLLGFTKVCSVLLFWTLTSIPMEALLPGVAPGAVFARLAVSTLVTALAMWPRRAPVQSHTLATRHSSAQTHRGGPAVDPRSRLVDVNEPPVPNRGTPLVEPPPEVVNKRLWQVHSTIVFGLILEGILLAVRNYLFAVPLGIFFIFAIYVFLTRLRRPVGICPFCGAWLESMPDPELIRCERCSEYSQIGVFGIAPFNPTAVAEKPVFRSPAFDNALWPRGCVVCGATPIRFDEARAVRYQARRWLSGAYIAFAPFPAAQIEGIPYCGQHHDGIQVVPPKEFTTWSVLNIMPGFGKEASQKRRQAYMLWRSLPMMRRYLAANRAAHNIPSAGHREPNILQRIVNEAVERGD